MSPTPSEIGVPDESSDGGVAMALERCDQRITELDDGLLGCQRATEAR